MRDYYLLCFLVAIPALAVLGHDVYLAYSSEEMDFAEKFYLSDLGWLWVTYGPDTYNWAIANIDESLWKGFVDPLLQQSAFYVAAAPAVSVYFILVLMKLFGLGQFESGGGKLFSGKGSKSDFSFREDAPAKKSTRYKRK